PLKHSNMRPAEFSSIGKGPVLFRSLLLLTFSIRTELRAPMPINALFSYLIKKRLQQIDLFRDNPRMAQLEVFHALIGMAKYTEWGRKYDYSSISDPDIFRDRVPIQD